MPCGCSGTGKKRPCASCGKRLAGFGALIEDQPAVGGRPGLEPEITRPLDYTTRAWPYATPMQHAEAPWRTPALEQLPFGARPVPQSRSSAFGPPFEVRPGHLPYQYAGAGRKINMRQHGGIGSTILEELVEKNPVDTADCGYIGCKDAEYMRQKRTTVPAGSSGSSGWTWKHWVAGGLALGAVGWLLFGGKGR